MSRAKRNAFQTLVFENTGKYRKLRHKSEKLISSKEHSWDTVPTTTERQEKWLTTSRVSRSGSFVSRADQRTGKSGLKDNNTIQKVSVGHNTKGSRTSTVAASLWPEDAFFYTQLSLNTYSRSVHETSAYHVPSSLPLSAYPSSQQEGKQHTLVPCAPMPSLTRHQRLEKHCYGMFSPLNAYEFP